MMSNKWTFTLVALAAVLVEMGPMASEASAFGKRRGGRGGGCSGAVVSGGCQGGSAYYGGCSGGAYGGSGYAMSGYAGGGTYRAGAGGTADTYGGMPAYNTPYATPGYSGGYGYPGGYGGYDYGRPGYNPGGLGGPRSGLGVRPGVGFGGFGLRR